MCSILTVKTRPGELRDIFAGLGDPEGIDATGAELRVHGYLKKEWAPVVFMDSNSNVVVRKKFFSLCPDWAKQWPFEFETYNARLTRPKKTKSPHSGRWEIQRDSEGQVCLESIIEVPSFRRAFSAGQTCLVPLSGAVESCYFGESAGKIVRFEADSGGLVFAAGLWNDWFNPVTGEFIPTFTLLTDDPDPTVFAHGHDRGIVAIDSGSFGAWLNESMQPRNRLEFLHSQRIIPKWKVAIEREMKAGWQKRAPSADEIKQMKVWNGVRATQ